MCNFNKQNEDTKARISLLLQKCAESLGGANALLLLSESLREKKPNPLIAKHPLVESKNLTIRWNKTVFKDKFDTLESAVRIHKSSENQDFNILDVENQKIKKKIEGMVKTLSPIEFSIESKEKTHLFTFKVFEEIDFEAGKAIPNPLFMVLFFCSTEYIKKALKY